MIDLFGLGKHKASEEPAPEADIPEPTAAPRGSHKLWAFLLVLDAVFVIVFAGALAAKIYQYWSAPAAPLVTATRRRPVKEPPKAVEAPAASTAAAAPAIVAAPPKAPEPTPAAAAKPVSAVHVSADAPRPPKPSILVDAPKHRGIPSLADAAGKTSAAAAAPVAEPKAAPAPAAPGGKVKALPAEFKIHAPKAKAVNLVGAFIVRGGRKEMVRQEDGNWTITLYLNPGQYRYFFSVDKKKMLDPENPNTEKGASVMSVP
jgi:hypothetical protein